METWFNPPAQQSLFMPGWFDDHFDNMSHYLNVVSAGVVVGTVQRHGLAQAGGKFSFKPHQDDLDRLIEALKRGGRIDFAAGAQRVMPATFRYHSFDQVQSSKKVWTATRGPHRLVPELGTSAGRQRHQRRSCEGRGRSLLLPGLRVREPARLRRERLPLQHHRQPAIDRDGARALRGLEARLVAAGSPGSVP